MSKNLYMEKIGKNAKIASNAHRFANLWERNNPNDQKIWNYSNFLNLKKKIEFVYFPPFYDPQHQFWAFLVDLVQNRKFLENRQTMKKNYYSHRIWKLFSNIHSSTHENLTRTKARAF